MSDGGRATFKTCQHLGPISSSTRTLSWAAARWSILPHTTPLSFAMTSFPPRTLSGACCKRSRCPRAKSNLPAHLLHAAPVTPTRSLTRKMCVCGRMGAYAFILFNSSKMLSDGSELLLLVPSVSDLVGSIVLPILGAVPDGAPARREHAGHMHTLSRAHLTTTQHGNPTCDARTFSRMSEPAVGAIMWVAQA